VLLVGANPNSQESFEKTTPLIAVSSRNFENRSRQNYTDESRIVTALINAGADVALQDANGCTALHYLLAQEHHLATARLILAKATKPINVRNIHGWTLLHCCASYVWSEEVESCIRSVTKNDEAATEARNKHDQTPLSLALMIGNKEAVAVLQEMSRPMRSRDRPGRTRSRSRERLGLKDRPEMGTRTVVSEFLKEDHGRRPSRAESARRFKHSEVSRSQEDTDEYITTKPKAQTLASDYLRKIYGRYPSLEELVRRPDHVVIYRSQEDTNEFTTPRLESSRPISSRPLIRPRRRSSLPCIVDNDGNRHRSIPTCKENHENKPGHENQDSLEKDVKGKELDSTVTRRIGMLCGSPGQPIYRYSIDTTKNTLLKDDTAHLFWHWRQVWGSNQGSSFEFITGRTASFLARFEKDPSDWTLALSFHALAKLAVECGEYKAAFGLQKPVFLTCRKKLDPIRDKTLEAAILLSITRLYIQNNIKQAELVQSTLYPENGALLDSYPWVALESIQRMVKDHQESRDAKTEVELE
jgi:ankyrin repeat protein